MNAQNLNCPTCGKRLSASALLGLCPDCLLRAGGGTLDLTSGKQKIGANVPLSPEVIGRRFPRLQVLELLGHGGMGAVYKARQKQLDRMVALKILRGSGGMDSAFAPKFEREARAMAKLQHPNIVSLFEFGEAGGEFYLLMEFVDGLNLRQLLNNRPVSPKEALAIVPQICDALQYAHDRGVLHRDIKPENILINKQGQVKIADFGVAKILDGSIGDDAGKFIGTPQYMSPEQVMRSPKMDHRTDIYALGVVFYQMLTGELPSGKIELPSRKMFIDARLDQVVLRALEKKAEHRYGQVSELKTRIETIVNGPVQPAPRKLPRAWIYAAGVAVLALAGGYTWLSNDGKFGLQKLGLEESVAGPGSVTLDADGSLLEPELKSELEKKAAEKASAQPGAANVGAAASTPEPQKGKTEAEVLTEQLKSFKSFAKVGEVDVAGLIAGGVTTKVHTDLPVERAMMVESVYLVRASTESVERDFLSWNPARNEKTNVIVHQGGTLPDHRTFASMGYGTAAKSMASLLFRTNKIPTVPGMLNLSRAEAAGFREGVGDGSVIPPYFRDYWLGIMNQRIANYGQTKHVTQKDLDTNGPPGLCKIVSRQSISRRDPDKFAFICNIEPYDRNGTIISPARDFTALGLSVARDDSRYWCLVETSDASGQRTGALVLGARSTSSSDRFRRPMEIKDRKNYISTYDLQYYVTSGHYAMLSKQRLYDTYADERRSTLIWQRDYILTPLLETPRGETRGQIANRLLPEIKARVETFRDQVQWTAK